MANKSIDAEKLTEVGGGINFYPQEYECPNCHYTKEYDVPWGANVKERNATCPRCHTNVKFKAVD